MLYSMPSKEETITDLEREVAAASNDFFFFVQHMVWPAYNLEHTRSYTHYHIVDAPNENRDFLMIAPNHKKSHALLEYKVFNSLVALCVNFILFSSNY
jgi:hypothetical protein